MHRRMPTMAPEMLLRHGLAFAVPPTFVVIKKEWVMFESKA